MVERQILGVLALTAVLAAIAVANIDACTFHRSFTIIPPDVDVMPQAHDRRHGKGRRRGMQDIVTVILFDKNGAAKPKTNGPSHSDSAERFIRKVQQ